MEDADASGSGLITGRRSRKVNTTNLSSTRLTDRLERTYEEMSQEGAEGSASQPRFRQPISASLNRSFPPPPSPQRYHGDGFDFRRPIMSTSMPTPSGVIDLTDDAEPPPPRSFSGLRFQRSQQRQSDQPRRAAGRNSASQQPEVIDLDDDEHDEPQRAHTPQQHLERGSSPEVEFLASNTLNNNASDEFSAAAPSGSTYLRNTSIANSIGMQLAQIFNYRFRGVNFARRHASGMGSLTPIARGRLPPSQRNRRLAHGRHHHANLFSTGTVQLPGDLDYQAAAFSFPIPEATPRPPTYQQPLPPRDGYTRAPTSEDVVVCPNCDHELGTGDNETKKQVWVVRACGHVYCGECTIYRTKKSRQGRSDITVPKLPCCVVENCGKTKTSGPKSMVQIYI